MQNILPILLLLFWRCKTNGFAGIYPVDTEDYEELKLDGETTDWTMLRWCFTGKFGGIRIWFPLWILGMLHMEIIKSV
jgi:translation elongation factor EF-4